MAMKRFLTLFLLVFPMISMPVLGVTPSDSKSRATGVRQRVDQSSALVELKGVPLATYEKTRPAKGKKIDFSSNSVKSHRAQLAALRNDFKQWLRQNAPRAKVTSEFDVALNAVAVQLNGTSLATIRSAPQVLYAEYQGLYRPTAHDDPDLGLIDAFEAWQLAPAGPERAGDGVKIAIIDSGIDVRHPCFSDAGYPEGNAPDNVVNGGTNDKVIYAEAFYNKLAKSGFGTADHERSRHARRWHRCLQRAHARVDRRPVQRARRHPVRPVRRRPGRDARQLQRLPGHARKTLARRTS